MFNKFVNISTILLIGAFVICTFMVMNHTADSNKITVDVARIQSKHKLKVLQEIALLTAEVRNLEKDIDKILKIVRKEKASCRKGIR
jgi:hypothetical protein